MDTDTGVSTAADGWGAKARGALQQTTDRYWGEKTTDEMCMGLFYVTEG